jgi:hypothetical protein
MQNREKVNKKQGFSFDKEAKKIAIQIIKEDISKEEESFLKAASATQSTIRMIRKFLPDGVENIENSFLNPVEEKVSNLAANSENVHKKSGFWLFKNKKINEEFYYSLFAINQLVFEFGNFVKSIPETLFLAFPKIEKQVKENPSITLNELGQLVQGNKIISFKKILLKQFDKNTIKNIEKKYKLDLKKSMGYAEDFLYIPETFIEDICNTPIKNFEKYFKKSFSRSSHQDD